MITRDYKIRVFVIFACFTTLFFLVITRLFLIQIKQKTFFKKLAKFQYEQQRTVYPPRASIYDRHGKLLAFSKPVWSAFLVPNQIKHQKKVKQFLLREYPDVYRRFIRSKKKHFLWLDRKLTPQKYSYLKSCGLSDIYFIEEQERYYPLTSASPVIGLTDIDNSGIAGLELQFTKELAGLPSRVRLEKDARSKTFYFKKTIHEEGIAGQPLVTTLDSGLQSLVHHELEKAVNNFNAQSGSVLIMNPDTGEILSMANYPSLDPNSKNIGDLDALKNDIVCECCEPGSVMKPFSALAALEEGVVEFDEPIDCDRRVTTIDGVKVENFTLALNRVLRENDFVIPFHDVVRYSSNVGMAKVTKRLETKLYDHLMRLGFGKKTGIAFPGERNGFINHPKNWSKPSPIVMSFGYEMMVSLLQLARAYCVIANGGYLVEPRIVHPSIRSFDKLRITQDEREEATNFSDINYDSRKKLGTRTAHPEYFAKQNVSKDHRACRSKLAERSRKLVEACPQVSRRGQEWIKLYSPQSISKIKNILEKIAHRFSIPGFRTMGKTGTARCVKDGKYSENHHNYTFAGIIEKGHYKRVIVTFIREPKETKTLWASQVSAPLFKAVAEKMVIRDMTRGLVSS